MTNSSSRLAVWVLAALAGRSMASAEEPAPEPIRAVRLTSDGLFKQRPAWSPDGKRLAYSRLEGAALALYVASADGSGAARLTDRGDSEYDPAWTPEGREIVFSLVHTSPNQGDLEVYAIDLADRRLRAIAKTKAALSHEESPAVSPDGKWVAYSSTAPGNLELFVTSIDGGEPRRLTDDPALDAHPAWSRDGLRIAFATDRWGDFEIAELDAASGRVTRLTTRKGLDDYPAFSPDGERLAFASNVDGNFEILELRLGDGQIENRTRHPARDTYPCYRVDGRLTWVSDRDGGCDIYLADP